MITPNFEFAEKSTFVLLRLMNFENLLYYCLHTIPFIPHNSRKFTYDVKSMILWLVITDTQTCDAIRGKWCKGDVISEQNRSVIRHHNPVTECLYRIVWAAMLLHFQFWRFILHTLHSTHTERCINPCVV